MGSTVLRRQPSRGDETAYVELLTAPEVEAWLRPPPLAPFTRGEIVELLEEDLVHWQQAGFGPWALEDEARGGLVGRAGLRHATIGGEWRVELAWTVAPAFQGRGIATDAALAGLELARSLGIAEVVVVALPHNRASRRVAEKAGLRLDGEVDHAGLPHLLYRARLSSQ
jgi:RimJ/RimL family protein N-acetyltransferase